MLETQTFDVNFNVYNIGYCLIASCYASRAPLFFISAAYGDYYVMVSWGSDFEIRFFVFALSTHHSNTPFVSSLSLPGTRFPFRSEGNKGTG